MSEIKEHKTYHKNGNVWEHTFYKDYKQLHGEYKRYYENGNIYIHTFYKDGKLHGEYKSYNENLGINVHDFYRNGRRITLKEYIKENNLSTKNILKLV